LRASPTRRGGARSTRRPFESRLQANIHVIGDAAIAGAMPKSAFAANAQAKVCAAAVTTLLRDATPQRPS
jgi:NADH dehydrogenase FAD-containing subunit